MLRFEMMKHLKLITLLILLSWLSGCASHETKIVAKPKSAPAEKGYIPEKVSPSKESAPAKDGAKGVNKLFSPEIVGMPLAGGKFAKLKIGLPVKEVESLIGLPDWQWQQPTSEDTTPYYTGTDRLLIQYAYKNEGILTFTLSQEHSLIRILVNRAE